MTRRGLTPLDPAVLVRARYGKVRLPKSRHGAACLNVSGRGKIGLPQARCGSVRPGVA